uniref:Serine protease 38 n=1 Tax=Mamestra configurata TaxID=174822 RepID=C9W8I0_9NEOP|nr:serine protease 38 [Mamestra configurata]
MKAFAFVLLCALAAVQGRHTGLQSTSSAAALGENPWLVHLRIAVSTSGLLETCAGSLIGNQWVLTAASCVADSRFIWVRYGVVNVINPSLVTENSLVRIHPDYNLASGENNIALININRLVESTENIEPIGIGESSDAGKFCAFGGPDGPGEILNCYDVEVSKDEDGALSVSSDEVEVTRYDVGAALVSDGAQVGVLVDDSGNFIATAKYADWLKQETGLDFA